MSKILLKTYEQAPPDFEALLGIEGVGPRTSRALALASGIPFPVDRETYDRTICILGRAVEQSAIDRSEKVRAFKRLAAFELDESKAKRD